MDPNGPTRPPLHARDVILKLIFARQIQSAAKFLRAGSPPNIRTVYHAENLEAIAAHLLREVMPGTTGTTGTAGEEAE